MQFFLDTYATAGIRPQLAREVLASYTEEVFQRAIVQPQERITVAECCGHLAGFAHIILGASHRLAPTGSQAELLRLYVQEPFTRAGLGTRLLSCAESAAANAGTAVMWLTPWVHNHRALAFYSRRKYHDFGRTHFTFEGETHENRLYAKNIVTD